MLRYADEVWGTHSIANVRGRAAIERCDVPIEEVEQAKYTEWNKEAAEQKFQKPSTNYTRLRRKMTKLQ